MCNVSVAERVGMEFYVSSSLIDHHNRWMMGIIGQLNLNIYELGGLFIKVYYSRDLFYIGLWLHTWKNAKSI